MEQPSFFRKEPNREDARPECLTEHTTAENPSQEFNDPETRRVFGVVQRLVDPHLAEFTDEAINVQARQLASTYSDLVASADAFEASPNGQMLAVLRENVAELQRIGTEVEKRLESTQRDFEIASNELKGFGGQNIYAVRFHDRLSNEIAGAAWALHGIQNGFKACAYWLDDLAQDFEDTEMAIELVEDVRNTSQKEAAAIAKGAYRLAHFFRTTKDTVDNGAEIANAGTDVAYGRDSRRKTDACLLMRAASDNDYFKDGVLDYIGGRREDEFVRRSEIADPASLKARILKMAGETPSNESLRAAVAEEMRALQQPWEQSFNIIEEAGILEAIDLA